MLAFISRETAVIVGLTVAGLLVILLSRGLIAGLEWILNLVAQKCSPGDDDSPAGSGPAGKRSRGGPA